MAKKKTGKEALAELKELTSAFRGMDKLYNKSHEGSRKLSEKILKAVRNFPAKERELYEEKIDKLVTVKGNEVNVHGAKNMYVH